MDWIELFHLGDLRLTFPVAAAIAAWLFTAGAWRSACWWTLLYGLAMALVGSTKVAFLGWGAGLPGLGFKALSGHATAATSVFPMLCYLLAQRRNQALRTAAAGAGLALGAVVSIMLVLAGQHTLSEAVGGASLGALVSLGSIRLASDLPAARPWQGMAGAVLVFALAALTIKSVPAGYLMARAAHALSGNGHLYRWYGATEAQRQQEQLQCARSNFRGFPGKAGAN
jgi:membrane-associated phospholipid phosphatase